MRSKLTKRILAETPLETKIFVKIYSDIVVRVHDLLKEKGLRQKDLAKMMDKNESEISRWLNGKHNLTLRSIAKLEAELGETILYVPKRVSFSKFEKHSAKFTVYINNKDKEVTSFVPYQNKKASRSQQTNFA